jgi:HSP20 family protein
MPITRFQPTPDLFRPLIDDMFGPFNRVSGLRGPDTDVIETEHDIRVVCELAGMHAGDIDVSLENNVLTISGEKQAERSEEDERGTWHLNERRWGRFTRSFVLPREVEQDRIRARYQDGVLTVEIPKTERARRRRIDIQDASREAQHIEARQDTRNG